MKKLLLSAITATLMITSCSGPNKQQLFNGESTDGWVMYTAPNSEIAANQVFTAKDGVISVLGQPFGYMRTAKKYADFTAHFEYRWTDGKGSNSGFFVRIQEGDKIWPSMVECQLQVDHAGDLYGDGIKLPAPAPGERAPYMKPRQGGEEKAIGDWNEVEVTCKGKQITIKLNGQVVNEGETDYTEGFIALQSEGSSMEFRNLWVVEDKAASGDDKPALVQEPISLFNGNDLDGWTLVADPESNVKAEEVFTVKDNLINVLGNPFGYMRTNKQYSNYRLHVEWRWVGEGSNSGIFQRVQDGDQVWPVGMECQLQSGNAGMVVGLNGYQVEDAVQNGQFAVKGKLAESSENAIGEWNTAEIECIGKEMKITINGVQQNVAQGQYSRGYVALQSEGGPLQFRNIMLTEL